MIARNLTQLSVFVDPQKADRFLSSGLSQDRVRLGLGVIEMVIPEQNSTQIIYCLCLQRQIDLQIYLHLQY